MKSLKILVLALAIVALAPSTLAYADSTTCPATGGYQPPISDNVSNSTGCQVGTTNNDNPLPGQVNDDNMFGYNTWQNFGAAQGTITGLGDTDSAGGTLTLNVNWAAIGTGGQLMIVLKGPSSNGTVPITYVGYRIEPGFNGTITWTTPFLSKNGNPQNTSHINAYFVQGSGTEVPEPASLFLMGTGLVGFARLARKRFQK